MYKPCSLPYEVHQRQIKASEDEKTKATISISIITDETHSSSCTVLLYQGSLTKRLSGDAWKDAVATAAVYTVFIAGIPLVRANWHHIQEQMQASGITFFYRLGNTYETTIRFQKPVSLS